MDIEMLITQRESVEDKLKKLEDMKPSIRESVYIKIRSEYAEKMREIDEKLAAEKTYLVQEISQIEAEEAEMSKRMEELSEEVDELKVRFSLGEYSEEEYNQTLSHKSEELEDYGRILEEKREKRNKIMQIAGEPQRPQPAEEPLPSDKEEEDSNLDISTVLTDTQSKGEIDFAAGESREESSPMDNILQPDIINESSFSLGEDVPKDEKFINENPLDMAGGEQVNRMESIDASLDDIEKMFDASLRSDEPHEQIEGLKCPKCGHINKPDLFNCEKCGSELL